MLRYESEVWQERCQLLLDGAVVVAAAVNVWSYDGRWGGEAIFSGQVSLSGTEPVILLLAFDGQHAVEVRSVSHRSANETTVHFVGIGTPPFSPHAVPMGD